MNFEPGITAGQCYRVGQELKLMMKRLTKIAPLDAHIFPNAHMFVAAPGMNESVGATLERAVSRQQPGFSAGFQLTVIILPTTGGDRVHTAGACVIRVYDVQCVTKTKMSRRKKHAVQRTPGGRRVDRAGYSA